MSYDACAPPYTLWALTSEFHRLSLHKKMAFPWNSDDVTS
jgi:hypothetical protein